jgi:hypothetical protein
MRLSNLKEKDLIQAIAFLASDVLPFFPKGGVADLCKDIQVCHQRTPLDLEQLYNSSIGDFTHDITMIHQYCRSNRGTFKPYCLKQAPTKMSA